MIGVCYIFLSFSKPDYVIARYNLVNGADYNYLSRLSADAAPAILDTSKNPYLTSVEDMLKKTSVDEDGNYNTDDYYKLYWMKSYYCKMENLHKGRQARLGKSYTLLYAVLPLRYCLGYWLVIPAWFCAYCKHCSWHHGKL